MIYAFSGALTGVLLTEVIEKYDFIFAKAKNVTY